MCKLPIALLSVWCNGVVDEGFDAMLLEVLLQMVAFVAEDREEVVDIVLGADVARQANKRVGYTFVVEPGYGCAISVVLVKVS